SQNLFIAPYCCISFGSRAPLAEMIVWAKHAGKEAVLPEVPRAPVARVVVLRISPTHPPEQNAQRVFRRRHCDQVDMIAHQAISQDPYASIREVLLHQP